MPVDRQHQLMRDVTLTIGGIVERIAEAAAGPADPRAATALFELPSASALAAARERRAVLVSVVLVDVTRCSPPQRAPAPARGEWLPDRRTLRARYVVTAWSGDARLDASILARLRVASAPFFTAAPEDLVGSSLDAASIPLVAHDEPFERDKLQGFWTLSSRAPAPSVVFSVTFDAAAA